MNATVAVRIRAIPWFWVGCSLAFAVVGFTIGEQHAWLESKPWAAWLPPSLVFDLVSGAATALIGLVALVLLFRRPRAGVSLSLCLAVSGAAWLVGVAVGPRWQLPRPVSGTITVQLLVPVEASLSATAVCMTEANGDRIVAVDAVDLGLVGIDSLEAHVRAYDPPTVELLVNGMYGYSTGVDDFSTTPDTLAATGSFEAQAEPDAARIGGPGGSARLDGRISWTCSAPTDVAADPGGLPSQPSQPSATAEMPLVVQDAIQGAFELHGVVDWVTCPDTGPCSPYGHAQGPCSAALPLRTDSIETVVPWTAGRHARLHLAPTVERATLTVEVDDHSPIETVTAPITLDFDPTTSVPYRALDGDFELAEGPLHVHVEWSCGDNFEPQG